MEQMKTFIFVLTLMICGGPAGLPRAAAQSAATEFSPITDTLSGLADAVAKVGLADDLPGRLTMLLWPAPGGAQKKCAIKKVALEGTTEGDKRMLILRLDNQDLVFAHFDESHPSATTKVRHEFYYRTTTEGNLTLALTATFQYEISDVEAEILKKVTWTTFGSQAGDGGKPVPMTADIRAQFESEKKLWWSQEKRIKKIERGESQ
jgi:hypothetical protein